MTSIVNTRKQKTSSFWITIDNLLASKKVTKKVSEQVKYSTTREIQKLMFLKQDPLGWAILTKGSHVKLLVHGDAMLRTVTDFHLYVAVFEFQYLITSFFFLLFEPKRAKRIKKTNRVKLIENMRPFVLRGLNFVISF